MSLSELKRDVSTLERSQDSLGNEVKRALAVAAMERAELLSLRTENAELRKEVESLKSRLKSRLKKPSTKKD